MPRSNILKPHTEEIINRYENGETTVQLSKIFGCSDSAIWNLLKRNNVKTRDRSHSARKYTANYNFFDIINTPEKAYVLGYFYADGSNNISTNRLLFSSVDTDILKKVLHVMDSNSPLERVSQNTIGNTINGGVPIKSNRVAYSIRISNKHLCESLEKLGGSQVKTYVLKFPTSDILPSELTRHMIRGYMDGDGFVYSSKTKSGNISLNVGFCGTIDLITGIQDYLNNTLGTSGSIRERGKICELNYKGSLQAGTILDHLYEDSTIHMDRKFKKYKNILEERSNPTEHP